MKSVYFIILVLGMNASILGQSLQDYKYIKVPVKFKFLKEENQYQLNALTAFLFEKKEFEVFFREDLPAGIDPCDVLQVEVHSDSGLFRSKLYFTLEDCKDQIVYTSNTGVSREKDFKSSYHEALRKAFESLPPATPISSNSDKEVVIVPFPTSDEIDALEEEPEEVIIDPVVTVRDIKAINSEEKSSVGKKPTESSSEDQKFSNGSVGYILKKSSAGFELYKEGQNKKFATLIKSEGGSNYLYSSGKISGNAFFDTSGNLVVEYLEPENQQVVSVVYKFETQ